MIRTIETTFLFFFFYSIFGWFMEVILSFIKSKKFINRGFLIGPYCPIYGFGALLITFLLRKYSDDIVALFCLGMILSALLEYYTSFLLEKIFKARWWDYSDKKFNLNGRVCAENTIAFGVLGVILVSFINPFVVNNIEKLSRVTINSIAIMLAVILILDIIVSFKIIKGFTKAAYSIKKDSTEEITKRVREILIKRGGLYKRLVSAFDFKASSKLILDFTSRIRDEAKQKIDEVSKETRETIKKIKKRNSDRNGSK